MEYLYKVLGIKATVQRAEFDHLPNYIAVRYRLQKVSMDGQKVIFLYPKTELEQIEVLKKHIRTHSGKCPYTEKREPACRAGAKRTQLSSKGISAS